jgi:hypothetical protein
LLSESPRETYPPSTRIARETILPTGKIRTLFRDRPA